MSADPGSLLFVYGTLRRDVGAPAYRLLARHGTLFDRGHVPGLLFDVGRYPALRLGAGPGERVAGEVHVLRAPRWALAGLDRYEGVAGGAGQYRRVRVAVATRAHGRVKAWVYEYLGDTSRLALVASGDYARHCAGRRIGH
jgi:gamma-glutamylcyclotransferase (GGCT)/AIG2-like uncharacterized protein YtfP